MSMRTSYSVMSLPNLPSSFESTSTKRSLCPWLGRGLALWISCATSQVFAVPAEPTPSATPVGTALSVAGSSGAATNQVGPGYRYLLDAQGLLILAPAEGSFRTVATLALPGEKGQLIYQDGHVYVTCGSQGVAVIDVSQPERPVLRSFVAQGHRVTQVSTTPSTLLVSVLDGGSFLFDIGMPGVPKLLRAPAVRASLPAPDLEVPPSPKPQRKGRPGLGLTIAGGATFGGLYVMTALWAGFEPALAIPIAGVLVASRGSPYVVPLGILMAAGQTTGLALFIAGLAKMNNAASSGTSGYASLRILPYASHEGLGMVASGRF